MIPIPRSLFHALVRDDPDFALTIMRLVVRRLRAALAKLDGSAGDLPLAPTGRRRTVAHLGLTRSSKRRGHEKGRGE